MNTLLVSYCEGSAPEVINYRNPSQACGRLPTLGASTTGRCFGGLTASLQPLLCGFDQGSCYVYDNGLWNLASSLNSGRLNAAASQSPFDGELWISGGTDPGKISKKPSHNIQYCLIFFVVIFCIMWSNY